MLRRSSARLFALLLLCGLFPLTVSASYRDNPPAQPGFTHTPWVAGNDTDRGLRLAGGPIFYSSPTIAEIDGNAGNGKEIAVGGTDGALYVYRQNGTLAWGPINVLPGGAGSCAYGGTDGIINTAPAVGALFDDGIPYIVVGYGTILKTNCPGGVVAYDGRNGGLKWRYVLNDGNEDLHGVFSSPALADVDGDGQLEVGFGNFERNIVLLNSNGTRRWRYHNADTVWSSPAFADADGDSLPDLIIGSDITRNSILGNGDGGYISALRGTTGAEIWRKFADITVWSSPAVADLDGDGVQEVIIGSGCFYGDATGDGVRDQFPERDGHWVKILNVRTGDTIRTLNASGCVAASPAVADLDSPPDGKLDIVVGVQTYGGGPINAHVPPTPLAGYVQAWRYDNVTPRWTTEPKTPPAGINDNYIGNLKSPVVGDIDGNGSQEVLIANLSSVAVLNGSNGAELTCNGDCGSKPTLMAWGSLGAAPALGNLDGDNDLEVVIGGAHSMDPQNRGYLYVWTNISGLGSSANGATPYRAAWPMFRRTPTHTGVVPALLRSPASVTVLSEEGGPARSVFVSLQDASGELIAWTATKDKSWLSVTPQGTAPSTLTITVNPAGKIAPFDETATVTVSSASGSPTISVRLLVVAELFETYLPLGLR